MILEKSSFFYITDNQMFTGLNYLLKKYRRGCIASKQEPEGVYKKVIRLRKVKDNQQYS